MAVASIDHIALPIADINAMRRFYEAFGFRWDESDAPFLYVAHLADQKLNFHGPKLWRSSSFTLRSANAEPGCGDFCFCWNDSSHTLTPIIQQLGLHLVEGPVVRNGGAGPGTSFYVRDPDQNLVEFICYQP